VNPYLGGDAISPFTADPERGIFLLCRTSNPGAADLQSLPLQDGRTLYEAVADLASSPWNENGNVGLVVGATWPEELANLRQRAPELPFLVPGVGAQGGDPKAVLEAGLTANKTGLLINASRSILYAGNPTDNPETFLQASAQAAAQLNTELNGLRDSE